MQPMSGKRSRTAGNRFESDMAAAFRLIGYEYVVTCRAESRNRDGQGIDLVNRDEYTNGRLPFNVQCKSSVERPQYDKLIDEMPQEKNIVNVVMHRYTIKDKAKRFQVRGVYTILRTDDFMAMAKELKELRETLVSVGKETL